MLSLVSSSTRESQSGNRIRSYRDLRVWKHGMELVRLAYGLTRQMRADERFELAAQIRSAAVSIPANIAEGHGRAHLGDYLRHLSIASGSLSELETHVMIAMQEGLVHRPQAEQLLAASGDVSRMLWGLTSKLRRRKNGSADP